MHSENMKLVCWPLNGEILHTKGTKLVPGNRGGPGSLCRLLDWVAQ